VSPGACYVVAVALVALCGLGAVVAGLRALAAYLDDA